MLKWLNFKSIILKISVTKLELQIDPIVFQFYFVFLNLRFVFCIVFIIYLLSQISSFNLDLQSIIQSIQPSIHHSFIYSFVWSFWQLTFIEYLINAKLCTVVYLLLKIRFSLVPLPKPHLFSPLENLIDYYLTNMQIFDNYSCKWQALKLYRASYTTSGQPISGLHYRCENPLHTLLFSMY